MSRVYTFQMCQLLHEDAPLPVRDRERTTGKTSAATESWSRARRFNFTVDSAEFLVLEVNVKERLRSVTEGLIITGEAQTNRMPFILGG